MATPPSRAPLGGDRPGRVKKKSLKVAAKEAAGGVDGARLERWTVRKFGALGLAHGFGFGLKLEPRPKFAHGRPHCSLC